MLPNILRDFETSILEDEYHQVSNTPFPLRSIDRFVSASQHAAPGPLARSAAGLSGAGWHGRGLSGGFQFVQAAQRTAPGPVANSAAGFSGAGWHGGGLGGGVRRSGGVQHQHDTFGTTSAIGAPPRMGQATAPAPVPGHLPSFGKWTDAPLPRGDHDDVSGELAAL